jgi:4-nitrophenyl phosphatase
MDGVLWHGDTPLPGLADFFKFLRANDIRFMLATNNSSLMPTQYSDKLARFGVQIPPEQVLTSSLATAAYVSGVCKRSASVYVIGGDGIRNALENEDLILSEHAAECVVVGWDRRLTWGKLRTASLLIHRGAQFVGTNPDNSYPTEEGPAPGNGAQLAAIQATTGVAPVVVGKPEPWLFLEAMRRMGATPHTTATVGDRIETDIEGGRRAGVLTILLLSGIARRDDVSSSPTRPDMVLDDIRELEAVWRDALEADR